MSRPARALAWLVALLLAACAELWVPRSLTLNEAELQAQLDRRFPMQRNLLDTFELQLSDPKLRLDAPARRLVTELSVRGTDRRSGRQLQGRLALDYGLHFEPADASIRLVQPRIDSLQFEPEPGQSARRVELAQRMGVALAERLLDDLVLYRVPAERLERLRAAGLRPGNLQVTSSGVEITLEALAVPAAGAATR